MSMELSNRFVPVESTSKFSGPLSETGFDISLHLTEKLSDNSDLDSNYVPKDPSDSDSSNLSSKVESVREEKRRCKKRKASCKEKIARKRAKNRMQWIDVQAKRERNLGLNHKNRKGNVIPAKEMKNPCKEGCRNKCREKISEQSRKEVFEEFWKIGDHTRQWDYIARCVKAVDKKQIIKKGESRRNFSRKYNIILKNNEILVCKTMFLNTFGISEQWVTTALDKILKTGFVEEDKRGKHTTRVKKINNEIINSIKQHIELFPVIPSHYTRKTSTKMYLEEGLNISMMHRLYLEYMQRNNFTQTATLRQYRDIFNRQYNIGFFKPKKDQCNICTVYAAATPEDKLKMQVKYEKHKADKEAARSLKDLDKEAAKSNKSVCASCFDLQKVLVTPQSAVSQFYYKSKLATYNFTIYDMGNNEGYCYVWNEVIAKRGPNEISSAILHFLKTQKDKGVTKVILYSDNCGGQNRNRFIFSMFSHASMSLNLEIIHRFLEVGHTQNEGDSMHSVIEHAKKRQPAIYTPDQWVMLIRMAKVSGRPYIVKEMSQNDFFSFKKKVKLENWEKDKDGKKLKINQIKELQFLPTCPNEIKFKYEYNEEFKSIQLKVYKRRNIKTSNMDYRKNLPLLYSSSLAIDSKKLKGLLELCKTNAIPKMYHNYYYSLLPKEEKEKKKKGKSFARDVMESDTDNNEYEDYLSIIESN